MTATTLWGRTVLCLTVVAILGFAPQAHSISSVERKLVNGATRCARILAASNAKDPNARKLVDFALALDSDYRPAVLLLARIERKLPIKAEDPESLLKSYTKWVLQMAEKNTSPSHKLLLYKVVQLLDPDNEIALVAEYRAKNKGVDTEFESLLTAIGKAAPQPDLNTGNASSPSSSSTYSSYSSNRIDSLSDALKNLPRRRTKDAVEEDIKSLGMESLYFSSTSPLQVLNSINALTFSRGYLVYSTASRLGFSSFYWRHSGRPYYSYRTLDTVNRVSHRYKEITVQQALAVLCSFYGLNQSVQDGAIVLREADDDSRSIGIVAAEELGTAFKSNMLDARKKYRGKTVTVTGKLVGSGKSMTGKELYMETSTGRIILEYSRQQDLDLEKYRQRGRSYDYNTSSYEETNDYTWRRVVVTGTCKGYGIGGIHLVDCSMPAVVY